jgi:hypothetical protein
MSTRNPRARDSRASRSISLGQADPRRYRDAQGELTPNNADRKTVDVVNGKLRVVAANSVSTLASTATLDDVISKVNEILGVLKG